MVLKFLRYMREISSLSFMILTAYLMFFYLSVHAFTTPCAPCPKGYSMVYFYRNEALRVSELELDLRDVSDLVEGYL
jgi:hypothetical protein